jgi:hypothetical protein
VEHGGATQFGRRILCGRKGEHAPAAELIQAAGHREGVHADVGATSTATSPQRSSACGKRSRPGL